MGTIKNNKDILKQGAEATVNAGKIFASMLDQITNIIDSVSNLKQNIDKEKIKIKELRNIIIENKEYNTQVVLSVDEQKAAIGESAKTLEALINATNKTKLQGIQQINEITKSIQNKAQNIKEQSEEVLS